MATEERQEAHVFTSPQQLRAACAEQSFTTQTSGQCSGFAQANLVCVPRAIAFDFLLFCTRNPKPCPLLEVLDAGELHPRKLVTLEGGHSATEGNAALTEGAAAAAGQTDASDIRKCLPKYRVFENGEQVAEVADVTEYWRDDLVCFLLGCSFSFEQALQEAGLPLRHVEEGRNVPMYQTNRKCSSAGLFHGDMVVSMRPFPAEDVERAREITERYPRVHGGPVHVGDPAAIGIEDINRPDFGEAVTIKEGEVPVFWACGVTPMSAVMNSRPELAITHAPGHMFVADVLNTDLAGQGS